MFRVALVHDWLTGMRGGEKVLLELARLFPGAPIFTLLHVPGSVHPELEAREIRTTFVQRLPGVERHYRHYLPLFPAAAATFDLTGFDLVVSSSHCVAKGVRVPAAAVHLCYCHTPIRYVWDRYDDYFGNGRVRRPARWVIGAVAEALRAWDVATAGRVDAYAANSAYVASRIRRYYGREAVVLPPPVDTEFFTPGADAPGSYDLIVSALAPYKRLELAIEAYRDSGRLLKIVGTGPEEGRLRVIASKEVTFLGRVDDETLRDLYQGCRAVLMPGIEDFGIVPVEAMACGRPAVVYGEGGGLESVIDGETGLVFRAPTAAALRAAVDSLSSIRFNTLLLRQRACTYAPSAFASGFRSFAERALAAHGMTPPW